MSKKPLADDRRRELATEAFAKIVRAAFKGESDKAHEALGVIESQYAEEIDILDRTRRIAAINLPCWMLDTDYNGMVFMARQVFFPKTSAWENLEKSLRGRFAEGVWAHLAGTVSEPFAAGPQRRIAVKVIDERGNELMVVKPLGG